MVKRGRIVAFFLLVLLVFSTIGTTMTGITKDIKLGLDLQGGFEILYKVSPAKKGDVIDKKALNSTVEALRQRVDVLGVSEPSIQIEGNDRIRVQLAGVTNQKQARDLLSTQANLTFRDVNDKVLMDGTDLAQGGAKQSFDQSNQPSVSLKLKNAKKFEKITRELSQKPAPNNLIVIWLDYEEGKDSYQKEATKQNPKYLSAASVSSVLTQPDVEISGGNFTVKSATQLAELLNAGSLPVKLDELYSTSVGAQFGEEALHTTILAGIIGIGIIFLYMLFFYRLPGLIAIITLSFYVYLNLLVFDLMHVVMTLPGIAALILGVGMAVDANIITYERIKDELKTGRSVISAYRAGNRRSLATIFDANITTMLAALVLFFYGQSSVKGFATTLMIGIVLSFITAVYGTRLLMSLLVNSRWFDKKPGYFGVKKEQIHDLSKDDGTTVLPTVWDKIDFVKYRKAFFTFSSVLVIIGIISVAVFRLNLGIDFTSGTRIEIPANHTVTQAEIQREMKSLDIKTDDVVITGKSNDTGVVRVVGVLNKKEIANLKDHFKDKYGSEPNVSTVSPTVGKELAKNAMMAIVIASIGIIIYVTIRFEFYMALAAVLALLHDAFFIVTVFSLTKLEVDLTFIAAVLTIVGYSINDTIVTFDRIRENMQKFKSKTFDDLAFIVNLSLRETFTRSMNTVLTVVIAVVALLVFGSESIQNFSIALLVGLILGAYSSVFIAAQLWLVWKGKQLKREEQKEVESK
ncbi:protein translocase subunit SecDF [Priestia megaterium]|jgi:SecD/SecF fusion protein|uniref:Multifunctional fusion protein n=2 Tax=Priestia megaterium TaxID=1404 RepID=A0A0B6AJ45_PRIM2|nr:MULTISPECIES: protein translocase subunit SecDF [Priestia]AJI24895.1 export membrane protein secDF [Priestia megaterium NBRC 15308 = ATCC 14581]AYE49098.1 protein translocase subunit SecDF [Priestia megaterium NCT-2]KFN00159.1 export membrane protein secDF [Priestia megaterium]KGJ85900.1 preprotein translocase subunit SecD [Priestia megaterium NBRC 15308 = ATCC 14581]KLV31070.1 preprotein translocase subunit SecD [Priestia megaterium]